MHATIACTQYPKWLETPLFTIYSKPTQNSQLLLLLVIVTTKLILHDIAHFYSDVLYSNLIIIIILLNEMFLSCPE